jgi:hypothetical protein
MLTFVPGGVTHENHTRNPESETVDEQDAS